MSGRRWAVPLPMLILLVGCGGSVPTPTAPTAPTSFLAGTWRGTVTIEVNPGDPSALPQASGAVVWRFETVPQTNLQSFRVTIESQHSWFASAASGSVALTPSNTPPASISTLGEFDSPRGCRGTFGSAGTAQAMRIEADFTGTDCQARFVGRVVLAKD